LPLALLPLAGMAGVCAAGCVREKAPPVGQVAVRVGAALPQGTNPNIGVRALVGLLTSESFLSLGADGREVPRVAESWRWNADRTALTLTLADRVYFHDGTLLTPALAAEILRLGLEGEAVVREVVPQPPREVVIRLSRPDAFVLPNLFAFSVRNPRTNAATGPFISDAPSKDGGIRLRAFDRYRVARPTIGEVDITPYPTQRNAWAALMRGDIDMLHEVSRDAAEFVRAESTVRTYSFPRPYYVSLVFNVRHPALARTDVRRAINLAIDKDQAVRDGMRSQGTPAESPIWPDYWANMRTYRGLPFNPEMARTTLDAAGFPLTRPAGNVMPARFSFTCLIPTDDTRYERLALIVQKQLFDIGIDMRLEPVTIATFGERLAAGDFDAFLFELIGARSLSFVYRFWHSATPATKPDFNSGYSAADAALDRVKRSASDEETRSAVVELLQVLRDDPPAVFIAWQQQTRAVSARFDVPGEGARDVVGSIWQWRLRSPMQAAR
jgi:peptide/nickel transport system substrate-binding protein